MYGDPNSNLSIGDIIVGDVDASSYDDVESIGDIAQSVSRDLKTTSKIRMGVSADSQGPAATVAKAAAQAAAQMYFGMPGAALENMSTIPMWAVNAKMVTPGTTRKIAGSTLKNSIMNFLSLCTWPSLYESAIPVAGEAVLTFVGAADPVHRHKLVPMVFITIAASTLVARAGGRLEVTLAYRNPLGVYGGGDGHDLTYVSDTWIIERTAVSRPIQLVYFPYVRVKDIITPNPAVVGSNLLDAPGAPSQDLVLTVKGLAAEELVQAVIPGLDSTDFRSFMEAFKVKY